MLSLIKYGRNSNLEENTHCHEHLAIFRYRGCQSNHRRQRDNLRDQSVELGAEAELQAHA